MRQRKKSHLARNPTDEYESTVISSLWDHLSITDAKSRHMAARSAAGSRRHSGMILKNVNVTTCRRASSDCADGMATSVRNGSRQQQGVWLQVSDVEVPCTAADTIASYCLSQFSRL